MTHSERHLHLSRQILPGKCPCPASLGPAPTLVHGSGDTSLLAWAPSPASAVLVDTLTFSFPAALIPALAHSLAVSEAINGPCYQPPALPDALSPAGWCLSVRALPALE